MFELTTPPSGTILSLSEIKNDLRIDEHDHDFDVELMSWQAAAVERVQILTRRQLLTAVWTLYLDRFPFREIPIWKAPVQSIDSIKYVNTSGVLTTLVAGNDYLVGERDFPKRVTPAYGKSWPATRSQPDAVRIEFTAGSGATADVSDLAKGAVKILTRSMFEGCECDIEPLLNQLRWSNQHETEGLQQC